MLLLVKRDIFEGYVITHLTPPLSIVRIKLEYHQDGSLFSAMGADA
jgi:hypothetical protein